MLFRRNNERQPIFDLRIRPASGLSAIGVPTKARYISLCCERDGANTRFARITNLRARSGG